MVLHYSLAFGCISQLLTALALVCTGVLAVRYTRESLGSVLNAAVISAIAGTIAGTVGSLLVIITNFCIQLFIYGTPASDNPAVTYVGPLSGLSIIIDLVIIFLYVSSGIILAPIGGIVYALAISKIPAGSKPA